METGLKCYAEYAYDTDKREAVSDILRSPDSDSAKAAFLENKINRELFEIEEERFLLSIHSAFEEFGIEYSEELADDMKISYVLYGVIPEEYIQFDFLGKNHLGKVQYLGDRERFLLFHSFYDYSQYEKVRNKWLQYQSLSKYFKRDCVNLEAFNLENKMAFSEFVQKHKKFIFKPTRLSCGQGVRVIESSANIEVTKLFENLCRDGGIADELIEQDKRTLVFHPQSVNTVRLIAFRGDDQRNHYGQALFRMGKDNGVIDNSSEAIRAMIDVSTGIVFSEGSDSFGNHYIFHPNTGVKIVGFEVPEWMALLDIADEVMNSLSAYARFIGFDFALSTEGWKIIEINPYPQIVTQQVIQRQGCKKYIVNVLRECKKRNVYDCGDQL